MAEVATEERLTTETEEEEVTPTEGGNVTEDGNSSQTDNEADPTPTEPDPHQVALQATREAALEEGRETARRELEEERRRSRDSENRRQLKEHFPATVRAMEAELNTLGLTDPAERQKVINHLSAFNLKAEAAILAPFEDAVQELIPAAVRAQFNEAADGKPAMDFQRTFAEFMAEHDPAIKAKALKGLKLEDLEKSSASLKAQIAKARSDSYDKGREKGRTDPAGESHGNERSASSGSYRTKTEARSLHVQNKLSNADMRRINADPSIPE